jgi:hypothetical protein
LPEVEQADVVKETLTETVAEVAVAEVLYMLLIFQ